MNAHSRSFPIASLVLTALLIWRAPLIWAEGFLHTRGQDIVDERGDKVLLRGVGLGNWLLPEGYMWKFGSEADRPRKIEKLTSDLLGPESAARFWKEFRRQYVTEADIQRIAGLGFNSVRPALNARLFLTEGADPVYVDEGFEILDNLVRWCKRAGIYVVIDMHAAPGGQTGANIDDSANDQPELFTDTKNQDRLVELWVKIATRYKDEPAVAGYDLLNEPLPARTGAEAKHKQQLEPLYQRIAKAIRAVDTRHFLTVEGADWANDWSVFTRPFDANLVYQFHYYCWDRPTHLNSITRFLTARERLGAPVWVGETGEKDNTIYWATTDYFEANNIGWSFWPWKKMDTRNTPYSIIPPQNWNTVTAYSRPGGSKPSATVAQKAFDELVQNIRLENCVFYPDVVNAILRRVPGTVEAENYGHLGLNKSYFVKETSQKSKYYRTEERVPVELLEEGRRGGGQAIRLRAGEWTGYSMNAAQAASYVATVRVKANSRPASFELRLNEKPQSIAVEETGWHEIKLQPAPLRKGTNDFKLSVRTGSVTFDWVDWRD